jgi:filamentous hemagglutinin family protein
MNIRCIHTGKLISTLSLSIMLSLSSVSIANAVNIVADTQAPASQQAGVTIMRENEVNIWNNINIQTPDEHGISHNKYTKFNINHADVVVLNNLLPSVNINGSNPNLTRATAKVILNEIRSSEPGVLRGTLRLIGQDAHVIIANPSGIDCNGCSFSNISHVTLTTGKYNEPSSGNNMSKNIEVRSGKINIGEKGINQKGGYLDLFSESVKINGEVRADDLFIISGNNRISLASPGEKMDIDPLYARFSAPDSIDVSAGGMYANKIRIISEGNIANRGTIRSDGVINMLAASGSIDNGDVGKIFGKKTFILAKGDIKNTGAIQSDDVVDMQTTGYIDNTGKIKSGKITSIIAGKYIKNRGHIGSDEQLKIRAKGYINNNSDGKITGKYVNLHSFNTIANHGVITSTEKISVLVSK